MVGDVGRKIPELAVRQTTETFLCHSQSPSFAEPRSPGKLDETQKIPESSYAGLKIRDGCGKDKKRQNPSPPDQVDEPEVKKAKVDEKFEKFEKEAAQLAEEEARRLCSLFQSNLDIHEMYCSIRSSASVIPFPKLLLLTESQSDAQTNLPNKCSVGDRQSAIFHLFSRRFGLKLCSETLHLGVALLDQCLDVMLVDEEAIADLAAVAMVIASKVEEISCITLRDVIDCDLVEDKTIEMISLLERMILTTLRFEVTFPTPLTFANYLLVHLDAPSAKIAMTNYLLELSLLDVQQRRHPSDVVAHAATCLAFAIEGETAVSSLKALQDIEIRLRNFCGIEMATTRSRDLMQKLAELFLDAPSENHVIFREYSTQRRYSVSLHPFDVALQKTLNIVVNEEASV